MSARPDSFERIGAFRLNGTAQEMLPPILHERRARAMAAYLGRCLGGYVRYRVNREPLTVYACHCTECQRRTGSAFALS